MYSFMPCDKWHKEYFCLIHLNLYSGHLPLSNLIHITLEDVYTLSTFSRNAKTKPFSQISISFSLQPRELISCLLFQRNNKTTKNLIIPHILILKTMQNKWNTKQILYEPIFKPVLICHAKILSQNSCGPHVQRIWVSCRLYIPSICYALCLEPQIRFY